MKIAGKPAWSRLLTDGAIIAAALLAAIYVMSSDAGASEETSPPQAETIDAVN